MADETKVQAEAAAEAPAKVAEAIADTVETVAKESKKVAKRDPRHDRSPREAPGRRREGRRSPHASHDPQDPHRRAQDRPEGCRAAQKRIETVTNNNFFNGFDAVPAFAPFQTMFADANERSQDLAKRSQKVAEELADLARANVEAIVEAGRVASEGARSIGQDVVATQP